jgi:hypothetical protein
MKNQDVVSAFNSLYKVGTPLVIKRDDGSEEVRKLTSQAWAVAGCSVVAKFEGISGGYDVSRVKQLMTSKTNKLGMSYYVPCDANGDPV